MTNNSFSDASFRARANSKFFLWTALAFAIVSCGGDAAGPVGPLPVATVSVLGAPTTFEVGQTIQFTAVPRTANGTPVSGVTVTWSVSPQSIATVTTTGLVTAIGAGTATVTATAGTIAGSAGVTITDNGIPFATTVSMPGNSFSPFDVTIRRTGSVAFDFPSERHDVTFTPKTGAPANIPVTSRAVISRTFNTIGLFPYDCLVHPGMRGQVTVVQ